MNVFQLIADIKTALADGKLTKAEAAKLLREIGGVVEDLAPFVGDQAEVKNALGIAGHGLKAAAHFIEGDAGDGIQEIGHAVVLGGKLADKDGD